MDNKKRYKIHGKHKGNLASRVSDFVIVLILSANQFFKLCWNVHFNANTYIITL